MSAVAIQKYASKEREIELLKESNLNHDNSQFQQQEEDPYYSKLSLPAECLIPPLTSGESSPNESDEEIQKFSREHRSKIPTVTSLEDVLSYLIDSSLLIVERDLPVSRGQNGRSDFQSRWGGVREFILQNVNVLLSFSQLKNEMIQKFKVIPYLHFESFQTIYFHGKYSLLFSLDDEKQAQAVYSYYKSNTHHFCFLFGDRIELLRVLSNSLNDPQSVKTLNNFNQYEDSSKVPWIPLVFRNLPSRFDIQHIYQILSTINILPSQIKGIEEPILLNERKHSIVFFNDLDTALLTIRLLIPKLRRDMPNFRLNLHPSYTKQGWNCENQEVNPYFPFYKSADSHVTHNSYSKTNQHLHFKANFLEDIAIVHKLFKQRRTEYRISKKEEIKKSSQRTTTPIYNDRVHMEIENVEHTSLNTPSATFGPSFEPLNNQEDPKQKSNHTIGYTSPVSKLKSGEPPVSLNNSPQRTTKHRKRILLDLTPTKPPHSSPNQQENKEETIQTNKEEKQNLLEQSNSSSSYKKRRNANHNSQNHFDTQNLQRQEEKEEPRLTKQSRNEKFNQEDSQIDKSIIEAEDTQSGLDYDPQDCSKTKKQNRSYLFDHNSINQLNDSKSDFAHPTSSNKKQKHISSRSRSRSPPSNKLNSSKEVYRNGRNERSNSQQNRTNNREKGKNSDYSLPLQQKQQQQQQELQMEVSIECNIQGENEEISNLSHNNEKRSNQKIHNRSQSNDDNDLPTAKNPTPCNSRRTISKSPSRSSHKYSPTDHKKESSSKFISKQENRRKSSEEGEFEENYNFSDQHRIQFRNNNYRNNNFNYHKRNRNYQNNFNNNNNNNNNNHNNNYRTQSMYERKEGQNRYRDGQNGYSGDHYTYSDKFPRQNRGQQEKYSDYQGGRQKMGQNYYERQQKISRSPMRAEQRYPRYNNYQNKYNNK